MATVAQVDSKLGKLAAIVHEIALRLPIDDQELKAALVAQADEIRPDPEEAATAGSTPVDEAPQPVTDPATPPAA